MDINIRPEVNILGVLRHLNYKPWFALAEFVDNSVGSALQHGLASKESPLKVSIDLDPDAGGRIIVRDNAAGIASADFPRAFRAAQVPPDRSGLSEFGMGMKSAATWFAREWRVITSVAGEPIERTVHLNIEDIQASRSDTIAVREAPADPAAHFTTIELIGLNHVPQTKTIGKIKAHLASIYREFLRSGLLELRFRGEPLRFNEVEPLVAPRASEPEGERIRWVKAIDVNIDSTHRVKGFAGLRARGSTAEAGFALLRRGRLILGSADDTYRPVEIFGRSTTYTYQRLYGELTLEGFEVSHTKDGFRWDEYEDTFLEALELALSEGDLDLIDQASSYRSQPVTEYRKPVEDAVIKVTVAVEDYFDDVASRILAEPPGIEEYLPDAVATAAAAPVSQKTRVTLDGEVWVVELEATLEDGIPDWIAVGAEMSVQPAGRQLPETHVKVTVSLAHPFSRKFLGASNENAEMIMAFASTVGLALALGKRNGARSQSIVSRINQLARETFAVVIGTEAK